MWRSLFVAGGVYLMLLGVQCLGVEKFVLSVREPPTQAAGEDAKPKPGPKKEISPSAWAPWSLMGTGAVICLYSFSIPSRLRG